MFDSRHYAQLQACAERELALRRRVYPRWVAQGKMSQDKADREIELQGDIVRVLARQHGLALASEEFSGCRE